MEDSGLVASILAGDTAAFERLMTLHKRLLFRTARAILRDDAEAEDAVQEAFLQAFRSLRGFRGEAKLSTWLVSIAANEALMLRRRRVRSALVVPIDDNADAVERAAISADPGPDRIAANADLRRAFDGCIEALPDAYRSVFRLRALKGLSVGETAAALKIPEATVRTRYFRARNLLREGMAMHSGRPASLENQIVVTDRDRKRLMRVKPHAALLREIDRAVVITPEAAALAGAVTMNTQVFYTDQTTGDKGHLNLVYPEEAGGCVCCVSVLAPVGTALLGLSPGQAIEWDFPDGQHCLRVDKVVNHDCPRNMGAVEPANGRA